MKHTPSDSEWVCFWSLVSELERVADHLVNIGYSIVNPTGDDIFEKKKVTAN